MGLARWLSSTGLKTSWAVIACPDDKKGPKVITDNHYIWHVCVVYSNQTLYFARRLVLRWSWSDIINRSFPLNNGNPHCPSLLPATSILSYFTSALSRLRRLEIVRCHSSASCGAKTQIGHRPAPSHRHHIRGGRRHSVVSSFGSDNCIPPRRRTSGLACASSFFGHSRGQDGELCFFLLVFKFEVSYASCGWLIIIIVL